MSALKGALQELANSVQGVTLEREGVDTLVEGDITNLLEAGRRLDARKRQPGYEAKLKEAADIIAKAMKSRYGNVVLQEALRTSEFPTYFGDVLDRTLLARFTEWVPQFPAYLKIGTFTDFTRSKRITQTLGGTEPLEQVGEFGPYPERGVVQTHYGWRGAKYGADFRISWHMLLADDLGAFTDFPALLASAARQAEMRFATELYVDANGPHASLINSSNGNLLTGNPPLSVESLETAYTVFNQMVDPVTGNPIMNRPAVLVVPPALEVTARKILTATQVQQQDSATPVVTNSIIPNFGLRLVVDPYIPIVASNANGSTSWFLFADPNNGPLGPGLAAAQFDRLRGMESPLLLQRVPAFTSVGGGADPRGPLDENESITYRVVHAFGGGQLTWQAVVGSNGSGS